MRPQKGRHNQELKVVALTAIIKRSALPASRSLPGCDKDAIDDCASLRGDFSHVRLTGSPRGLIPGVSQEAEELMRRIQLSVGLALALSVVAFTGAQAQVWCAVGTSVHNHARIMLHHKTLAKCDSNANGCKCVSCYN